jgi:enolase
MVTIKIQSLDAIEIIDSRGNPTIECYVYLDSGIKGVASVPSGASTGTREVCELRDNNIKRFSGKGVLNAVDNIRNIINKNVKGKIFTQKELDETLISLDGTENKSALGGNAILAVSLAFADALAKEQKIELYKSLSYEFALHYNKKDLSLPVPLINIINGGKHADNRLDIQEFMIAPVMDGTFSDALTASCNIFHKLKEILQSKSHSTNVGDEGGFAPNLSETEEAIELILEAIHASGYIPGKDILLAIDAAASELYNKDSGLYFDSVSKKFFHSDEIIDFYNNIVRQYPIFSIEDAMAEHDIIGWKNLTSQLGSFVQLVGDDLFVTNKKLIEIYSQQSLANAVLIKPNQIGTLTETFSAIASAKKKDYSCIISHRSGETEDSKIADIAVAVCSNQIKTGSLSRSDRLAKYNQLLRIEHNDASINFAGPDIFNCFIKRRNF